MRVLILSCNTGEGHNSCGKAIRENFLSKGIDCEMVDSFQFISTVFSKLVTFTFVRIYRHFPGLFRFGYEYSEKHPRMFGSHSGIYKLITYGADKLYRYIQQEQFDTIICPHVFTALIMTDILRRYHPNLKTYFIATDYTCSPSCGESNLDAYFIPDADLTEEFVRNGIPKEKLIPSGIPIREGFSATGNATEARKSMELPENCRHMMIMCGSMGCGPIRKVVRYLAQTLPENCWISVICGTNEHLRKTLAQKLEKSPRIRIYGFVTDISTMMDSADLYLTKPGGISVTEASHKHLPMVFVNAVAGCESYNMNYFMKRGGAATTRTPKELAQLCTTLLTDDDALTRMKASFPEFSPIPAAEQIVQQILSASSVAIQK